MNPHVFLLVGWSVVCFVGLSLFTNRAGSYTSMLLSEHLFLFSYSFISSFTCLKLIYLNNFSHINIISRQLIVSFTHFLIYSCTHFMSRVSGCSATRCISISEADTSYNLDSTQLGTFYVDIWTQTWYYALLHITIPLMWNGFMKFTLSEQTVITDGSTYIRVICNVLNTPMSTSTDTFFFNLECWRCGFYCCFRSKRSL